MKFIKEVDSMDQKDVQTVANPVYGNALKVHKQKQDNFKLVLDEVDDASEDAIIEEPKIEKRKEAKEMGLQEKLLLEEDDEDISTMDFSKRIKRRNKMREDAEVVETSESETPQLGPDSILASMLNNLIVDEWNTIDAYNSALTYIEQVNQDDGTVYDYEGIKKILTDIVNEENVHVGQLQSAMQLLSPNTASIDKGTEEGDKQIAEGDSEDIMTEAVMDDPNAKEVLTKTAEGNVDKLIKQLEDAVTTTGNIKPGIEDEDKAKEVNDEVSLKLLDMIDYLKSLKL